jgi:hypothetical protein
MSVTSKNGVCQEHSVDGIFYVCDDVMPNDVRSKIALNKFSSANSFIISHCHCSKCGESFTFRRGGMSVDFLKSRGNIYSQRKTCAEMKMWVGEY